MKRKNTKNLLIGLLCFSFLFGFILNVGINLNKNKEVSDGILGSPSGFMAESTKDGSVTLSWNTVDNANGYEVWQAINGGDYSRVQILTNTTTNYIMLNKESMYSYKVCAWVGTMSNRNCGNFCASVDIIPLSGNVIKASDFNKEDIIQPTPETTPNLPVEPVEPPIEEPNVPMETPTPTPEIELIQPNPIPENKDENDKPIEKPQETPLPSVPQNTPTMDNKENVESEVPKVEEVKKQILLNGNKLTNTSLSINWELKDVDCDGFRIYQKINNGDWELVQTLKNKNTKTTNYSWLRKNSDYEYKVVAIDIENNKTKELLSSNVVSISLKEDIKDTINNNVVENKPAIAPKPENNNTNSNTNNSVDVNTNNNVIVNNSTYINDILNGTNNLRKQKKLNELVVDETLNKIANGRAKDMANNNYFSHYKDGKLQLIVVRDLYKYSDKVSMGENIARTTATKDIGNRFVKNWTNSTNHYENMTNKNWTKIGIGIVQSSNGKWYGVQIFSE